MDNSLKDKVLEAADIVAVVGERVALKRQGKEYVGLCPFHADHRPSMSVSPQKQIFKCWSCGAGGDVIRFVQLFERLDFREALESLAERLGIQVDRGRTGDVSSQMRESLLAATAWARGYFERNLQTTEVGKRAWEYARGRGLTDDTIRQHNIGLAMDAGADLLIAAKRTSISPEILEQAGLAARSERGWYDRFRNRLIFPIADGTGRPVAFGGRTLGDDRAKYLNSPETVLFSKSRVLYGLDLARRAIEERRAVIVVEGYLDAALLHQYGFTNTVATLGTALTDAHVKLLRPRAGTIYLCFDSDAAGVKAADRAVEVALRTDADVRVVTLSEDKDPADCLVAGGASRFEGCLKAAVDALEFKWLQTLRAFDAGGQRGRRAAIEAFLAFVAGAATTGGVDPLTQNLLVGRLSELMAVPPGQVFDLLLRSRRRVSRVTAAGSSAEVCSAYEVSVRGLPAGLVTAVETVFGLLLGDRDWAAPADGRLAAAIQFSQTWQQLYEVLLEVRQRAGKYSLGEVLSRCDDACLCELVSRARARVAGVESPQEEYAAAGQRLEAELAVQAMAALRSGTKPAVAGADAAAYGRLLEMARHQHGCLSAEQVCPAVPGGG